MKIKVHNPNNLPTLPYEALLDFQGDLKIIDDAALEKLKQSIIDHGFIVPKFVWQDGEFSYIMDGHQTRKALDSLASEGYDIPEIPIVRVEANNRQDAAIKLLQINSRYGSLNPETNFFDRMELAPLEILPLVELPELEELIIDEVPEISESDDNVPELSESDPIIKRGDFFRLGKHYLLCGDSTQTGDVEKVMNGEKADMCLTDPPYGMNLNTDWSTAKSNLKFAREKPILGGKKYDRVIGDCDDFNSEFITSIFSNFADCKEVFLWGADYFSELLENKNQGCWFVWDKRIDESADKMYGSCFELCWSKQKHKREIVRIKWAGLFHSVGDDNHRVHPTQKSVLLVEWFIEKFSKQDDIVIDPFLGSGTTLIACEKLNRRCRGIEISPKYCEVIIKRWFDTFINDDFEHVNGNLKLKEIVNND